MTTVVSRRTPQQPSSIPQQLPQKLGSHSVTSTSSAYPPGISSEEEKRKFTRSLVAALMNTFKSVANECPPGTIASLECKKTEYQTLLDAQVLTDAQVKRVQELIRKANEAKQRSDAKTSSGSEGSADSSPRHSPTSSPISSSPPKAAAPAEVKKPLPTVEEGCREILKQFMSHVRLFTAIQDVSYFTPSYRTYRELTSVVGVNIPKMKEAVDRRWNLSDSPDSERIKKFTLLVLGMACEQPRTVDFALFLLAVHPEVGTHSTLNHPLRHDPATNALRSKHNFKLTTLQSMTSEKVKEVLTPIVLKEESFLYRYVGAYLKGNCNEQPARTLDLRPPIPGISAEEDVRFHAVYQMVLNLQDALDRSPRIPIFRSDYNNTGHVDSDKVAEKLPIDSDAVYFIVSGRQVKTQNPSLVDEYAAPTLSFLKEFKYPRAINKKLDAKDLEDLAGSLTGAGPTLGLFYLAAMKAHDRSVHFGPQTAAYTNNVLDLINNNRLFCAKELVNTPFFRQILRKMGATI